MYFKYDLRDKFQSAEIVKSETLGELIPPKYKQKLPISAAKKKDLLALCKKGVIPREFHHYYKALQSNAAVQDTLLEPDAEESDVCDTDA